MLKKHKFYKFNDPYLGCCKKITILMSSGESYLFERQNNGQYENSVDEKLKFNYK